MPNRAERFWRILEVPMMYALMAESMATIPIQTTTGPASAITSAAAVATGAGDAASTAAPTLPISAMLRRR